MSNSQPLQIWDNAAFDDLQWLPLQPISAKENMDPTSAAAAAAADIDAEIEVVEKEIARLSKKLHLLKIKKNADPSKSGPTTAVPTPAKPRGRVVPAKFMIQESTSQRRGLSLGPMEISRLTNAGPAAGPTRVRDSPATRDRGLSIGPMEISRLTPRRVQESPGSRRRGLSIGPTEISTPLLRPGTGQRKPCAPRKLEGIEEEKRSAAGRRGMSIGPAEIYSARRAGKIQEPKEKAQVARARRTMSTSPKPRRAKVSDFRNGVSTVGAKKPARREEGPISSVKPKALFQETKRPNAKVRVVASRYNEPGGSKKRKWSLPGPGKVGPAKASRSLSLGGPNARSSTESMAPASPIALPRIRTVRLAAESPRDSGCAKRVADLVGRRSCFAEDGSGSGLGSGSGSGSPCQSLNFDDED